MNTGKKDGEWTPEEIKELLDDLDQISEGETDEISEGARELFLRFSEEARRANEEFASGNVMVNPEAIDLYRKIIRFFNHIREDGTGTVEVIKSNMKPQIAPNDLEFRTPMLLLYGQSLLDFADLMEQVHSVEILPGLDGMAHIVFNVEKLWIPVAMGKEETEIES